MAPLSFIGPIKSNTITSSFQPLLFPLKNYYYSCSSHHNSIISLPRNIVHHVHGNFVSPISHKPFLHRNLLNSHQRQRGRGTSFVAFDANKNSSEEEEEEDTEAVDAFMNKNKNFLSFFQGKTQVLELFKYLIRIVGKHIDIVVKPTLHDGMNIGVRWKFKWEKIHIGKGFSFHIYQSYHGRAVIKNIEMFMWPLLLLVPFRLKMRGRLAELVEKIGGSFRAAKAILCVGVAVLFLLGAFIFFFCTLSS